MNIDRSKTIVVTNKFEQLKQKYNNDYNRGGDSINSASWYKEVAVYSAINDLLDILSEMVMED